MQNTQKGSIMPVILVIIALLVIGGSVFVYKNKKVGAPSVTDTNLPLPNQTERVNTLTTKSSTKPSITVIFPNGGEKLVQGQVYNIKWVSLGLNDLDKVSIDLVDDSTDAHSAYDYSLNNNSTVLLGPGIYSFKLSTYPNAYTSAKYKIRVVDLNTVDKPTVFGDSNYFSIVSP